jgi:hypothetical protein
MKKIAWLSVAFLIAIGAAYAQNYVGTVVYTPGSWWQCITLKPNKKYAAQAKLAAQDYSYNQYLFSSTEVLMSQKQLVATVGNPPSDGGYIWDGGTTFWQMNPPIILKDTDSWSFTSIAPNNELCYHAGTTADGGVSAMKLTVFEVVPP